MAGRARVNAIKLVVPEKGSDSLYFEYENVVTGGIICKERLSGGGFSCKKRGQDATETSEV